jgi:hypothetical protein
MRKRLMRVLMLALLGVVSKTVRKKLQERNEPRATGPDQRPPSASSSAAESP